MELILEFYEYISSSTSNVYFWEERVAEIMELKRDVAKNLLSYFRPIFPFYTP